MEVDDYCWSLLISFVKSPNTLGMGINFYRTKITLLKCVFYMFLNLANAIFKWESLCGFDYYKKNREREREELQMELHFQAKLCCLVHSAL